MVTTVRASNLVNTIKSVEIINEEHIFNKINHDDNFQERYLFSKLSCFKKASLENNSSNKTLKY